MTPNIVQLNVGGQLFTTTTATLTSPLARGSMLERLVALHMQEGQLSHAGAGADISMAPTLADPRHPGSLFIDRDGSSFSYILNYLRDGGQVVPPTDLHATQLLLREAQYYQLTGLIQLLQAHEAQLQQAKADQQQQADKIQQQAGEIQRTMQFIQNHTAEINRYLQPWNSNDLDQRQDHYEGLGELPRSLLVNEMAEAVDELLERRSRQP